MGLGWFAGVVLSTLVFVAVYEMSQERWELDPETRLFIQGVVLALVPMVMLAWLATHVRYVRQHELVAFCLLLAEHALPPLWHAALAAWAAFVFARLEHVVRWFPLGVLVASTAWL